MKVVKYCLKFILFSSLLTFTASCKGRVLHPYSATQITNTFEVLPYIQPGNYSNLSCEGKVIIWQTHKDNLRFTLKYGTGGLLNSTVNIHRDTLSIKEKNHYLFRAALDNLLFDSTYQYQILANNKEAFKGSFTTRTRGGSVKFVSVGDTGDGSSEQITIAKQILRENPHFILHTGDFFCPSGLLLDYKQNVWPQYNSMQGTLLMSKISIYLSFGNHDVMYVNNLTANSNGMAAFDYFDLPQHSPSNPQSIPLNGTFQSFKQRVGNRFPNMLNYSFDFGNVHIVCLDSNDYVDPRNQNLQNWLRNDLRSTAQPWKIVAFHHPPFFSTPPNFLSSPAHGQQRMRLLASIFEQNQVKLVFSGHIHNYQRTYPLRFQYTRIHARQGEHGRSSIYGVEGNIQLDNSFDGNTITQSNGVIYVINGGGGASLHNSNDMTNHPNLWQNFTRKYRADTHSFSVIETNGNRLEMKQINACGQEIDKITITQ